MSKYVFPAVFTEEKVGYSINFPDVDCCFTQSKNIAEGIENAEDVLMMMLADLERNQKPIPKPTPIKQIKTDELSFATMILCDTSNEPDYDKQHQETA